MKLKIGITGGIGSGKSSVAEIIKSSGYSVLNADDVAKEIMLTDEHVKASIKSVFGQESYSNEYLNKDYLTSSVFASVESIQKMNSIVHPPTIQKIEQLLKIELERKDLAFVEAALIYESEMDAILDHILLVTSSEEIRINRIMKRDSKSNMDVLQRMKFQMPENEKENLADFVLLNDLSFEELKNKAKFFLMLFETMSLQ